MTADPHWQNKRRKARRTAAVLACVAVLVFAGFIYLVMSKGVMLNGA